MPMKERIKGERFTDLQNLFLKCANSIYGSRKVEKTASRSYCFRCRYNRSARGTKIAFLRMAILMNPQIAE